MKALANNIEQMAKKRPRDARSSLGGRVVQTKSAFSWLMTMALGLTLFLTAPAWGQDRWYASRSADGKMNEGVEPTRQGPAGRQFIRLTALDQLPPQLRRTLSLHLRDATLAEALGRISEQSGVNLIYGNYRTLREEKVTLHLEQATVMEALSAVIQGTDLEWMLSRSGRLMLVNPRDAKVPIHAAAPAPPPTLNRLIPAKVAPLRPRVQTGTIAGTVTDSTTGEFLPGVNVVIEGTMLGAATDAEGQYTIAGVEPGTYDLLASFVGYTTKRVEGVTVTADDTTRVDIALRKSEVGLEEVVVIGYGTVQRRDLTGSVASIETEDIEDIPTASVESLLRGKATGAYVTSTSGQPRAGATIRIRGANSISANNEPLYVVDGFVGVSPGSINPDDIESIQVLKDASATAIYGARGSNGVILITTKRGTEGAPRINVGVSRGWQTPANTYELMNGPERAGWGNAYKENREQPPLFENPDAVPNTDWQELVLQTAPITDVNLSISGGSEQTQYYFSASYLGQEGIVKSSGYQRLTARLNLDADLNARLHFGTTLNLSREHQDEGGPSYWGAVTFYPFMPIYNEDGSFAAINPYSGRLINNPISQLAVIDEDRDTRLLGNLFAEYTLLDGLTLRTEIGGNFRFEKLNDYDPTSLPTRGRTGSGGRGQVETANQLIFLNENTLTYDQTFGEHSFNAVAGVTYQHSTQEGLFGRAEGFVTDAYTFNNLAAGDPTLSNINSGYSAWTILSFLGRVNYSYKDRYLFTVTARRDGSSRLGANNKWAFFPSAAVAWRLSEEPFVEQLGVFNDLKLRASYGVTGNQAVGVYATLPTLATRTPLIGGVEVLGVAQGNLSNPNLKWETTRQLDVGLEGSILGGRLSFVMDYYYERTTDLLLQVELPGQTGYDAQLTNIGTVQNQGLELRISSRNIVTSDFLWSTTFNLSGNRNKVLDLGPKESIVTFRYQHNGASWKYGELFVDEPIGTFVGAVYKGVWPSQEKIDELGTMPRAEPGFPWYADVNGNGSFDAQGDFTIIGNPNPDFFGGLRNTFQYKGFSLSAFFQFVYGNDVINLAKGSLLFGDWATNQSARLLEDAWSEDNPDGTLPKPGAYELYRNLPNTLIVEDGSFLRLQYLTLGYDLPVERVGLSGVRSLRVYVTGENLWLLTNYSGLDPEVSRFGSNSVQRGFDRAQYPRPRTFTIGLNLGF